MGKETENGCGGGDADRDMETSRVEAETKSAMATENDKNSQTLS